MSSKLLRLRAPRFAGLFVTGWVFLFFLDSAAIAGLSGACCSATTCTLVSPASCQAASGLYQGDGTSCTPNPCLLAEGETCIVASECVSGNCADSVCCDLACDGAAEACNAPGSVGTCIQTGACCDGSSCSETSNAGCLAASSDYQGDGTTCATNPCPSADGEACASGAECLSGFCADSVCCDSACDGSFEACNRQDSLGMCVETEAAAPAASNWGLLLALFGLLLIGGVGLRSGRPLSISKSSGLSQ